jgi:hypothetical protein
MDMILHRRVLVLVAGVALALAVAFVLPKVTTAAPPGSADATFTVAGACDFPVLFEQTGKLKVIGLPGPEGAFLVIFAGGSSTLTNVDEPTNQVTLRGGGIGRVTPQDTGDWLVEVEGHNILVVPGEGIFDVRHATFTLAPPFDVGSELTILESQGKLTDLCALLE